jgi:class 3 adenylate cyclase/tetratricopeptide (TPR) repeat protein
MNLQEDLDPEAWAGIMGRFVQILAEGVRQFGGTVDKFTGDGIMALFGAPVAQEDHARRACHAAWHLAGAIGAYGEELRRSQGLELHVRLGINSGEVVVGRVGDDLRLDPTALGHTVSLAQRMEAVCEPGRVYLTEQTARLVDGWFRLGDLGPKIIKGAREPLRVYVLEGPALSTTRGARALGGSHFVGRAAELAVLEDGLAAATEGRAQVIGVVGEAGVGKSRLCEEFACSVGARGITVRRTTGVSHGREVPLLPILSLLRAYFSITEADEPHQAREKVAGSLLALDPRLVDELPLLFDFLEVHDPEHPAPKLAPDVRMRRIFEALRRMTARRSEREVLAFVFEDLHWFDPQSEAFLERLVESFPGTRTLVVTNFRPEFSASWMRHSYYRQLPLAPLGDKAVGELLGGLLGLDFSLAALPAFVLGRTGGNPFFVEEVVRTLVEDGTLVGGPGAYRLTRPLDEVRIPPSVQAVLAARIDRLSSEDKAVLQTAAVIGRTFPETVLARVAGVFGETLEETLRRLCAAELLQETQHYPVVEYRFWHPLTQEVAYETLLARRRARFHAAVAEALIEHESGRLDERAAVLSWHWERAGNLLEAARWGVRAAGFALRTDLSDAMRRWRGALSLLQDVEESPESLNVAVQARIRLLQFGARMGIDPEEAECLYAEGRPQAEHLGDAGLLGILEGVSGSARFWRGDLQGALTRYLEAARLGQEAEDPALLLGVCFPLLYTGPLVEALAWTDRVLEACAGDPERGAGLVGYSPLGRALQIRAGILARTGRLAESATEVSRALEVARSRAEAETVAFALAHLAQLAWLTGAGGDGLAAAIEAVRIGEDTGNVGALVLGLEGLALAHLAMGQPAEAVKACERALAEARMHQSGLFEEAATLAHLAQARLVAGDQAGAEAAANEAVAVARRQQARTVECLALVVRAEVGRATAAPHDRHAILADLDAGLHLVRDTGALTYEPFIREQLGRLDADQNQLREALRLFNAIGAHAHVRRLEAELEVPESPVANGSIPPR